MHGSGAPSPWLLRWAHLLPPAARVLDVACGGGRHALWLAAQGHIVTGVDRDPLALEALRERVETCVADIESGLWPWPGRQWDAVLITNYLWRPLWPTLREAVLPGGLLIHETFAVGNETVGKPARADFLLRPGELLSVFADWRIVAFEEGFLESPARFVQRVVAHRPQSGDSSALRIPLTPPGGRAGPG